MEAETASHEAQDRKEYQDAMKSNEIEKTGRTQEVEMKTQEKARRVDKIASLRRPKKNTLSKERARGPQQEQVAQSSYGRHQGDNNDSEIDRLWRKGIP